MSDFISFVKLVDVKKQINQAGNFLVNLFFNKMFLEMIIIKYP